MSPESIAAELERSPSTIRRELARNQANNDYDAQAANRQYHKRRNRRGRLLDTDQDLAESIVEQLEDCRSVRQALHLIKPDYEDRPSHETVYDWMYQSRSQLAARGRAALIRRL